MDNATACERLPPGKQRCLGVTTKPLEQALGIREFSYEIETYLTSLLTSPLVPSDATFGFRECLPRFDARVSQTTFAAIQLWQGWLSTTLHLTRRALQDTQACRARLRRRSLSISGMLRCEFGGGESRLSCSVIAGDSARASLLSCNTTGTGTFGTLDLGKDLLLRKAIFTTS